MGLSARVRDALYATLGIIGLAAWMLYILACLPTVAWSPDSNKVVFVYQRADLEEAGVALYDRTTRTTRRLYVSPDFEVGLLAGWTQDGKHVIVYQSSEDPHYDAALTILLFPVQPDDGVRLLLLGENRSIFTVQPPERDGDLFLGGEWLMRLDLATGEYEKTRYLGDGTAALAASGDRIFYVGEESAGAWELAHRSGKPRGEEATLEIGELEPQELTLRPLFELKRSDVEPFGVERVYGAMWVDASGTRFALVGDGDEHGAIVLCNLAGLEGVVSPQIPFDRYRLGNPQWSLDGETIYVGTATASNDADWLQFSIAEMPVAGGPARLVPIVRLRGDTSDLDGSSGVLTLPTIALSPDGSTLAVAATLSNEDDELVPERLALFLVDLREPQRPVSEIRPTFLRSSQEAD